MIGWSIRTCCYIEPVRRGGVRCTAETTAAAVVRVEAVRTMLVLLWAARGDDVCGLSEEKEGALVETCRKML
jgi:hypothetical protein